MINTICDNNDAAKTSTAFKATISKAEKVESSLNNEDKHDNIENSNYDNSKSRVGRHGMWYKEANNVSYNTTVHKQQCCNNVNSNNKDIRNKNLWLAEGVFEFQKDQQTLCTPINNESDIIIVDIENDDNDNFEQQNQQQQQQQQQLHSEPQKIFINRNMKLFQNQQTICDSERGVAIYNINYSTNSNTQHIVTDGQVTTFDNVNNNDANNNDDDDDDETEKDDENDSLASMETLSDNVSIWIDGEKHWVAGVDANTTCSELIWALLNYQSGQQPSERQSKQKYQHAFTVNTTKTLTMENIAATVINKSNSNQYEKHELQRQQQQLPNVYDKNILELNLRMSTNEGNSNTSTGNKPNIHNTAYTNNTPTATTSTITTSINQSMPTNTKENFKTIQSSNLIATTESSSSSTTPIISPLAPVSTPQPTLLPVTLPPGIATVSQLITEYVIVKQYQHCEEYLDGSTKVFDVLPSRNGSNKKAYELLLRHLGPAPVMYNNNTTPQLSSLISTDKDSGMGSPVGSARSAKFRRRKHKSSQWLAQANTLHPKLPRCTGNERLMKIILAQDETIQRQLSLLREKERQITKIEEEKHRKRERELGKNYLLETYLNGLDEADCEPEIQDGEEIFIDEPCYRTKVAPLSTKIAIKPATVTLAAGALIDKIPSATEALNMTVKHKIKDKEMRKEKKKKRHKEKQIKDEDIQAKDFNLKINKNKDREKVEAQQRHQHELKAIDGNTITDNGNEKEIELQVFWLEKIYTLNKQLQKEEEQAAKLHAKVRKHQLRNTQQTQREVQMEIDKLDNNLALQFGDIRKVEANLMQANEQLQKKLLLLERLSVEYLQEQQEREIHMKQENIKINSEKQCVKAYKTNSTENLEKSMEMERFSLNNIKSKEEVIKLEKIIAKPNIDLRPENTKPKEINSSEETIINNLTRANAKTTAPQTSDISSNAPSVSTIPSVIITSTDSYQQQNNNRHHSYQQELTIPPAITETGLNDTESTSCMYIDKNMLSSLHVQNAKTIKKQMFHTQTTAAASASTASTQLLPPRQTPLITSGFPKRQFQQTIQQQMPMASTFLTSRPQISHQIQATNIVIVQKPFNALPSCSARLSSTTSLPLSSATVTATASSASILKPQYPPTSTSPSPSIMAMNTVDISQLGTLV